MKYPTDRVVRTSTPEPSYVRPWDARGLLLISLWFNNSMYSIDTTRKPFDAGIAVFHHPKECRGLAVCWLLCPVYDCQGVLKASRRQRCWRRRSFASFLCLILAWIVFWGPIGAIVSKVNTNVLGSCHGESEAVYGWRYVDEVGMRDLPGRPQPILWIPRESASSHTTRLYGKLTLWNGGRARRGGQVTNTGAETSLTSSYRFEMYYYPQTSNKYKHDRCFAGVETAGFQTGWPCPLSAETALYTRVCKWELQQTRIHDKTSKSYTRSSYCSNSCVRKPHAMSNLWSERNPMKSQHEDITNVNVAVGHRQLDNAPGSTALTLCPSPAIFTRCSES